MRISNSKAATFRRCQNKYKYKYVYKIEPKKKSIQLERGSWLHLLLQHHYTTGRWKPVHRDLTKAFYQLLEEVREDLGNLPDECLRIMRSYLRYWRTEDQHWRVVDAEVDEVVTLSNGLEFHMIVDLIAEDLRTGTLWPWDHKSRASFASSDDMVLDPQLTSYYEGLKILGFDSKRVPLGGVLYNEVRTKAPIVPKLTQKTRQLERRKNIDTDVATYMSAIRDHGFDPADYSDILRHLARLEHERFFRRVKLPKDPPMLKAVRAGLVKTARDIQLTTRDGTYVRTFDKSCHWCDFKSICIAELHGGDPDSMIRAHFRRRKSEDELEMDKPWQG